MDNLDSSACVRANNNSSHAAMPSIQAKILNLSTIDGRMEKTPMFPRLTSQDSKSLATTTND